MNTTGQLLARRPLTSPHETSTCCRKSGRFLPLALLLGAGLLLAAPYSRGAVYSWSGGATTANWSESANWGFAGTPANGDTVIFPASQPKLTNTNNISNLSLSQIRFVGAGGGYAIWGNSFTIGSGGIQATNTAGANTINNAITLGASPVPVNVGSGVSLTLAGVLGGTGGLTKSGTGTLTLSGSGNNTYSGATLVSAGLLQLSKSGVAINSGSLTIGAATVREMSNTQLGYIPVTVNAGGTLDLNGFSDTIGTSLTLNDGTVLTGAGTLWLDDNATITVSVTPSVSGNLQLQGTTCTIQGSGSLYLYANVSGSVNIVKDGTVGVLLYGANTFTGTLTASTGGYIYALNNLALGATNGGTIINDSAYLALGNGISITGEALTMNTSDSYALDSVGSVTNTWAGPISLSQDTMVYVATNGLFEIIGSITGAGGLTKWGPGTLTFSGTTGNYYSGVTTVNEGQLDLNKSPDVGAFSWTGLVIGDGTGTDTVRCRQAHQIWADGKPVTINSSGVLNLNGFQDSAIPLTMRGGQITTGAGSVLLADTLTVLPEATTATINGNASLYRAVIITNTGHSLTYDLTINAIISGGNGITKTGAGAVRLNAANTFSGPVTINQGTLSCWNSDALGNTNTAATVNSGGTLHLAGNLTIGLKPLVLNGPGWDGAAFVGALAASDGVSSWAGVITNASDSTIYVYGTRTLDLSGPISGPGSLTKAGTGTNIFSGTTANTYSGTTRVDAGTLVLDKSSGVKSVPGNLVIGDGSGSDVVILGSNNQIAVAADVFIQSGGLLECGAYYALIDTLRGSGTVNFGTLGYLAVGEDDGTSTFDGPMTGIGFGAGYTLAKMGSGTFTMNGDASFTAGITHVYDSGKLIVNGSLASAVTVDSAAALGGTGTVGALTANGTISPGVSPGRLGCGNVAFGSSSSLAIELNGNTAGSGHDQLNVAGSVTLTGAALSPLTVGFQPAEGDQFVIVNNNGSDAVTNTFDGLAEGAVVSDSTGKFDFRISYAGGTGNDVVLTMTNQSLEAGDAVVWSGNGNGAIETNECNLLSLEVRNISLSPVSGLKATLRSLTPGVAVLQPYSSYPNIPVLSVRTNDDFFQITTQPGFDCGAKVDLELQVGTTSHGTLKVPFSLPSGVAGSVVRYNNNVTTAIPDAGTLDKTFTVSGITTPLKKVVVSLHITHTADSDLDISLIGPDGTTVVLSSDNGGTGDDYGADCGDDRDRTTFDSTAATSIIAGTAPFVGRYRPEQSLEAFNEKSGADVNGTWTLRIADDTAGAVGSIRCCSLLLYPTACTPGSGICELCPDVTIKSYTGPTTPLQSGYLQANNVVSACGSVKACPPTGGGNYPAESFTFRNGPSDACITVIASHQNPSGSLVAAAYLGSFNPAAGLCVNYLADAGYYVNASHPSQAFSFDVPANAVFVINVLTDVGGMPYTLAVSGGNCRPVLNATRAGASNLELGWTTAAPGYRLEGASPLNGVPWVAIPPNPPVVVDSKFKVTNTMNPTNYFYRLHKQ